MHEAATAGKESGRQDVAKDDNDNMDNQCQKSIIQRTDAAKRKVSQGIIMHKRIPHRV